MTFKDLSKKLNNTIQTVPNLINVLKEGFAEVTAGSDSKIDYKITEQDTGLKWVDDSKVYQLTISTKATNRSAEVDLTSYGIKDIIEASARIKAGDYTEFPGYYGASNDFSYIYYQDSNKKIRVDYGGGLSTGATVYLTIRYTKATEA